MRKPYIIIFSAVMSLLLGCTESSGSTDTRTFFAMDTAVTVTGSSKTAEEIYETVTRLDGIFDRYSESSDIFAINSRCISRECANDTVRIIRESEALSEKYGNGVNIFAGDITDCWDISSDNPSVPSDGEITAALKSTAAADFSLDTMRFADENGSIDLGSVAKGYALDRVSRILNNEEPCIVSMTSSVLLHGKKSDGSKFSVSIRDPLDSSRSLGTVYTDACFLSTSGGYERFFEADGKPFIHIFDLETGMPSESDLISVTVMCDSGIESDFLSTLIFTEGSENLGKYLSDDHLKIAAVTKDKKIFLSSNLEFELSDGNGYTITEHTYE